MNKHFTEKRRQRTTLKKIELSQPRGLPEILAEVQSRATQIMAETRVMLRVDSDWAERTFSQAAREILSHPQEIKMFVSNGPNSLIPNTLGWVYHAPAATQEEWKRAARETKKTRQGQSYIATIDYSEYYPSAD